MFRAAHIAASVGRDSVIELSRRRAVNRNSPAYEDNVQDTYKKEGKGGGEGEPGRAGREDSIFYY